MQQTERFDRQGLLDMAGSFRGACVLGAAAELDLFTLLAAAPLTAEQAAARRGADPRGMRILLDALTALGLLTKHDDRCAVPAALAPYLAADSPQSILPMIWHSTNILRHWTQLARVVQEGHPAQRQPSVRGAEADRAAFVAAMHTVSGPMADELVARLGPPPFTHLLDVGGASGTWTLAFLRARPAARATLFDLPDAVAQARARFAGTALAARVSLVEGDFYRDALPAGADYAWLSAIIHQHSRAHNRALFAKVRAALVPGGRIGIRDIVMDASRTRPAIGALFAVNMLVGTESGGTFTFDEIAEDLRAAGFQEPRLAVAADDMSAVVEAVRR
jgi:precorrin-6B methylase 2